MPRFIRGLKHRLYLWNSGYFARNTFTMPRFIRGLKLPDIFVNASRRIRTFTLPRFIRGLKRFLRSFFSPIEESLLPCPRFIRGLKLPYIGYYHEDNHDPFTLPRFVRGLKHHCSFNKRHINIMVSFTLPRFIRGLKHLVVGIRFTSSIFYLAPLHKGIETTSSNALLSFLRVPRLTFIVMKRPARFEAQDIFALSKAAGDLCFVAALVENQV